MFRFFAKKGLKKNHLYTSFDELMEALAAEENSKVQITQHSRFTSGVSADITMSRYMYRGQSSVYMKNTANDTVRVKTTTARVDFELLRWTVAAVSERSKPLGFNARERQHLNLLAGDVYERVCNHPYVRPRIKGAIPVYSFIGLPVAQHYEFPTPGIDVTDKFEVAGAFAAGDGDLLGHVGVIFRIDTKALCDRTRLNVIPDGLEFQRPKRQSAYVVDLSCRHNAQTLFDYDLYDLKDIVEPFFFVHKRSKLETEAIKQREEELLAISGAGELAVIRDCLISHPETVDATDDIAYALQGNLCRICNSVPYTWMQQQTKLPYSDRQGLIEMCNAIMVFDRSQVMEPFRKAISAWEDGEDYFERALKHAIENNLSMILKNIENEVARPKLKPVLRGVCTQWKPFLKVDRLEKFIATCKRAMSEYERDLGKSFSAVALDQNVTRKVGKMVNEKLKKHAQVGTTQFRID